MPKIVKSIDRPNEGLAEEFLELGVATIHESIGKGTNNVMSAGIKPILAGMRLAGPAVTVDCFPGDNSTVHLAMTLAKAGDVLVVNGHSLENGMIGGQMAYACNLRKIGGVVVDGGIRDSAEIKDIGLPCFARHIHPLGTIKQTLGSINVPIQCGGVVVTPGDIVVGDDDGIVVVPRMEVEQVLQRAKARLHKEADDRRTYASGKTSFEMLGLEKLLNAKDIAQVEKDEGCGNRI